MTFSPRVEPFMGSNGAHNCKIVLGGELSLDWGRLIWRLFMGWLLSMVIIGIAIGSNSTFSKINFFYPPIRFYGAESLSVSIPRNIHFGANQ